MSIITLNINGLITKIKRQRFKKKGKDYQTEKQKQSLATHCLPEYT